MTDHLTIAEIAKPQVQALLRYAQEQEAIPDVSLTEIRLGVQRFAGGLIPKMAPGLLAKVLEHVERGHYGGLVATPGEQGFMRDVSIAAADAADARIMRAQTIGPANAILTRAPRAQIKPITRSIGIDMAHRVPSHAGKCKNLHGHRYTIEATCGGVLVDGGPEDGMVMDFGFLKDLMLQHIDGPYDHGLALGCDDPLVDRLVGDFSGCAPSCEDDPAGPTFYGTGPCGKFALLPYVPTVENLAEHWHGILNAAVRAHTSGRVRCLRLRVYETPNCWADHPSLAGA